MSKNERRSLSRAPKKIMRSLERGTVQQILLKINTINEGHQSSSSETTTNSRKVFIHVLTASL